MTGNGCRLIVVLLCLVLIGIPLVSAATCPEGCSCMVQSAATQMGYDSCGGKLTACGSDPSGYPKYCYATTRATRGSAPTAFAGSDCPSVSGLALLGGTTFAQAGISGRDGIHCQYSLPGTCREQPCTAILRVDRTGSPAAAAGLMNTISPPGTITSIQRIYTVVDSGQSADHRFVIFKNNPGNNDPRATNFAGAVIYRQLFVIQAESGDGYWVVSDSAARSTLTSLENAGKTVADRKSSSGVPGSSPPAAGSPGSLFAGESPSPESISFTTPPGTTPEEILENFLRGLGALGNGFNLLSPLDVNWNEVPGTMAEGVPPAMLGALGALLGGSIGALALFPAGFSWPGTERGGGGDDGETGSGSPDTPGGEIPPLPASEESLPPADDSGGMAVKPVVRTGTRNADAIIPDGDMETDFWDGVVRDTDSIPDALLGMGQDVVDAGEKTVDFAAGIKDGIFDSLISAYDGITDRDNWVSLGGDLYNQPEILTETVHDSVDQIGGTLSDFVTGAVDAEVQKIKNQSPEENAQDTYRLLNPGYAAGEMIVKGTIDTWDKATDPNVPLKDRFWHTLLGVIDIWTILPGKVKAAEAVAEGVGAAVKTGERMAEGMGAAVKTGEAVADGVGAAVKSGERMAEGVGAAVKTGDAVAEGVGATVKTGEMIAEGAGAAVKTGERMAENVGAVVKTGEAVAEGAGATVKSGEAIAGGAGPTIKTGEAVAEGASSAVKTSDAVAERAGASIKTGEAVAEGAGATVKSGEVVAEGTGASVKTGEAVAEGTGATVKSGEVVAEGTGASVKTGETVAEGAGATVKSGDAVAASAGTTVKTGDAAAEGAEGAVKTSEGMAEGTGPAVKPREGIAEGAETSARTGEPGRDAAGTGSRPPKTGTPTEEPALSELQPPTEPFIRQPEQVNTWLIDHPGAKQDAYICMDQRRAASIGWEGKLTPSVKDGPLGGIEDNIFASPPGSGPIMGYGGPNAAVVRIQQEHIVPAKFSEMKNVFTDALGKPLDLAKHEGKVIAYPAPQGTGDILLYIKNGKPTPSIPAEKIVRWRDGDWYDFKGEIVEETVK